MGPEAGTENGIPVSLPDEERESTGEGHHVAPRRADGPVIDEVLPPLPPDREHHGG